MQTASPQRNGRKDLRTVWLVIHIYQGKEKGRDRLLLKRATGKIRPYWECQTWTRGIKMLPLSVNTFLVEVYPIIITKGILGLPDRRISSYPVDAWKQIRHTMKITEVAKDAVVRRDRLYDVCWQLE